MARRTVWRDIFRSGCDCVYGKVARPQVQRAHLQTAMLKFLHKFWLSGIPPAAAGGILVNITCVETLAGLLCVTEWGTSRGRFNQADHREFQSECAFGRGIDNPRSLVRGSEDYGIG